MSQAQWRWAMANRMPWAHRVAHKTKGPPRIRYQRLPVYKRRP